MEHLLHVASISSNTPKFCNIRPTTLWTFAGGITGTSSLECLCNIPGLLQGYFLKDLQGGPRYRHLLENISRTSSWEYPHKNVLHMYELEDKTLWDTSQGRQKENQMPLGRVYLIVDIPEIFNLGYVYF